MGQRLSLRHSTAASSKNRRKGGQLGKVLLDAVTHNNSKEVVESILKDGADPNASYDLLRQSGEVPAHAPSLLWTALHEACRQNLVEVLSLLLEYGGDIDLKAHHAVTPLNVAARHGHKEAVTYLIQSGCDVNALDKFQESVLVIPICNGDLELINILLEAGCRLNTRTWANVGLRLSRRVEQFFYKDGPYSLVSLAIIYGHFDVAMTLLQHGYKANKYEMYVMLKIIQNKDENYKVSGEIDKEGRNFIECYVAAEQNLKTNDEINRLDRLLVPPNDFNIATIAWVKKLIGCPSMKALCRMKIRSILCEKSKDSSIYKDLDKIPLPKILVAYLKLEEFSNDDVMVPTYAIPQQCACCIQHTDETL